MQSDARPILAPVDFSPDSQAALVWAAEFAAKTGAPIVVLHVVHEPGREPGTYRQSDEQGRLQELESVARDTLNGFVAETRANFAESVALDSADLQVVTGLPATRILEVAEMLDAQQIVMGSRGLTGLKHLILGSKAERVVQLAPIPVTIVKRDQGVA